MKRFFALLALLLAVAVVTTPVSAEAGPGSWCSALANGSPTIDIVGDSLSTGDSVADVSKRYHTELGDSLRADGAPGTQVWIGGAIDGSATADYVSGARYSGHIEFTVNHPNLILLGWGINDWAGNIPPATFQAQYQQIINRIRALSPDSTLMLVHMPWVYNTSYTSTHGSQTPYQLVIRTLADLNGAKFVDLVWPFAGGDPYALHVADLVHLSAAGQNVQFAALRAAAVSMCY